MFTNKVKIIKYQTQYIINKLELGRGTSMGWLFFHCFSNLIQNLECWPLVREEKQKKPEEKLSLQRSEPKTNSTHLQCHAGNQNWAQQWEVSFFTTVPSLLSECHAHLQVSVYNWWSLFVHVSNCSADLIEHLQNLVWWIWLSIPFLQQLNQLSSC